LAGIESPENSKGMRTNMNRIIALLMTLGVTAASTVALAGPMEREELYDVPAANRVLPDRLVEMMRQALNRPDALTRIEAMNDIGRHEMRVMVEEVIAQLTDERALVRTAAVDTLNALDARQATDRLMEFITLAPEAFPGPLHAEQIQVADAMLGRWGADAAAGTWARRLGRSDLSVVLRVSAARALGQVKTDDPGAVQSLRQVAAAPEGHPALRLAAAEALGRAVSDGLVGFAEQRRAAGGPLGAMLAVRLIASDDGDAAVALLKRLAAEANPAVRAVALEHLRRIDPSLVWPFARQLLDSADPKVRLSVVRSLAKRRELDTVELLIPMLNDVHPEVRDAGRVSLEELAKTESLFGPIRDAVRAEVDRVVKETDERTAERWRAAEQAALLVGYLDDKPIAGKLVTMVEYPRTEPRLAAVDSLRSLDVADTRSPLIKLLARQLDRIQERAATAEQLEEREEVMALFRANRSDSEVAAEICQTMGVWGVAEADPVMRRLVPKKVPFTIRARVSAIWGLGLIHEDEQDVGLARQLSGRLTDLSLMEPEADEVREMAAVSIGRMRGRSQLGRVRGRYRTNSEIISIRSACRWAIGRITGEMPPAIEPADYTVADTFVTPID